MLDMTKLKSGDSVGVCGGRNQLAFTCIVDRVTPTGQVVLSDGSRWTSNGRLVGELRDAWTAASSLMEAEAVAQHNAPLLEVLERSRYIHAITDLPRVRRLTMAVLRRMFVAMEEGEKLPTKEEYPSA